MKRCLKKHGKLLVLEFSKPINPIFSKIMTGTHSIYFQKWAQCHGMIPKVINI